MKFKNEEMFQALMEEYRRVLIGEAKHYENFVSHMKILIEDEASARVKEMLDATDNEGKRHK